MTFKERYIEFCQVESQIPIFSQPWWLDIVCGSENWEVILVEKGGQIVASFPYYMYTGTLGMHHITLPVLTQKLGPYIKYPKGQKPVSKLSYEKEILEEIIDKLPEYDSFNISFDYKYTNWLPFYWKGFRQSTRYTYVVNDISDAQTVFNNFHGNKRTDIRKAEKYVEVRYDLSGEEFLEYYVNSLKKQGKTLAYSVTVLLNLCQAAYDHNHGRIIYAIDDKGNIHSAILYVWDAKAVYSLVTAFDPEFRTFASSSLLFYQIMKDFSFSGLVFDFEGSMIENIESSYNKFGTIQTPYFRIYKLNSRKCKFVQAVKDLIHAIRN